MNHALAPLLVAAAAAIPLLLGVAHLVFTFSGPKLLPRDPELRVRMAAVSPVITRQTTMWRCWVGFNASHSVGLMLFGAVYGALALGHGEMLFDSAFLLGLGLVVLIGYVGMARAYFFRTPFVCTLIATALYAAGLVIGRS